MLEGLIVLALVAVLAVVAFLGWLVGVAEAIEQETRGMWP